MSDNDTHTQRLPAAYAPGNSQYAYLLDTTRPAGDLAPTASLNAPGSLLGKLRGRRVIGIVEPTAQGVTLQFYVRKGRTGTSADWALDTTTPGTGGTGQIAVAAGSAQPFSWAPAGDSEVMVVILAGATAPTALFARCSLLQDRTAA